MLLLLKLLVAHAALVALLIAIVRPAMRRRLTVKDRMS